MPRAAVTAVAGGADDLEAAATRTAQGLVAAESYGIEGGDTSSHVQRASVGIGAVAAVLGAAAGGAVVALGSTVLHRHGAERQRSRAVDRSALCRASRALREAALERQVLKGQGAPNGH